MHDDEIHAEYVYDENQNSKCEKHKYPGEPMTWKKKPFQEEIAESWPDMKNNDLCVIRDGPAEAGASEFISGQLAESHVRMIKITKLAAKLQFVKKAFPVMLETVGKLSIGFKHGSECSFIAEKLVTRGKYTWEGTINKVIISPHPQKVAGISDSIVLAIYQHDYVFCSDRL